MQTFTAKGETKTDRFNRRMFFFLFWMRTNRLIIWIQTNFSHCGISLKVTFNLRCPSAIIRIDRVWGHWHEFNLQCLLQELPTFQLDELLTNFKKFTMMTIAKIFWYFASTISLKEKKRKFNVSAASRDYNRRLYNDNIIVVSNPG